MMAFIGWIIGTVLFFVPAFLYYIAFYVTRFGWFLGLILGVIFVQTLFPLHFIIAPIFGADSLWNAFWNTWGKVVAGSIIVWIFSSFQKDKKK
ncbi:MAG: hypothetical protein HZA34_01835 [Candidatus Pacebacteria bacterium]|nr:hypothetical protein [Candidatus Paceibacterota bacterium]